MSADNVTPIREDMETSVIAVQLQSEVALGMYFRLTGLEGTLRCIAAALDNENTVRSYAADALAGAAREVESITLDLKVETWV